MSHLTEASFTDLIVDFCSRQPNPLIHANLLPPAKQNDRLHPSGEPEQENNMTLPRPGIRRLIGISVGLAALFGVGLSGLATAGPKPSARPDPSPTANVAKPTIVLEHGAWADASSWGGVIRRLQSAGYNVVAPPDPLRGLSTDSQYLRSFLSTISGPVVLVGHSYGGAVITNAATGDASVKALVYVDAFAPAQGETVSQLVSQEPGSCLGGGGDPTKVFNFVQDPSLPAGDVELYLKAEADGPYPGFAGCFANDLKPARAAALEAEQRPLAFGAISEPSGPPAWATIPSWYLVGTEDHVIPPAEQLFMAKRAGSHIVEVPASHLSLVSHPDAVTRLIECAARSAA
jgi:pimeloyl-ACP methyl ester carboxylesterase